MMVRKLCFTLLAAMGLCQSAPAFDLNPSLSLLTNFSGTHNDVLARSGEFLVENRKMSLGIEFTNKFYLPKDYFVKTGIRINSYRTTIAGLNEITVPSKQKHIVYWSRGYNSFTVPVHIGREFISHGHRGDVYIGGSAGVLASNNIKSSIKSYPGGSSDVISSHTPASTLQNPAFFFATADIGASYQPLKAYPRFRAGFMCSVQLNQTDPLTYEGTVRNETQGNEFRYDMQHTQRFINYALTLTYTFGKLRPAPQKQDPADCPK